MTAGTLPADMARVEAPAKPVSLILGRIVRYLIMIGLGLILIAPFILAALGSFKSGAEIIAYPPTLLPKEWLVENWVKVWNTDLGEGGVFPRWLLNTAFLSVIIAVAQVVFCSMAAYAFARLRFPGREGVFSFMLATLMIPGAVTVIPAFVLMAKMQLLNTYWSLILPGLVSAGSIFMLTQFFKAVPVDLEEAAHIDGASQFQIYKDVLLPLARPALLTVFILQFQAIWNNFLTPLLYLDAPRMWVLNVALSVFRQQYRSDYSLVLVGAMFNAIPVLVLFFLFSKYYIEGAAYAGVKG
ncbi:MAG: carbohydrate ABC transporter permease [Candidatus Promineifilaceae bacterium]